MEGAEKREVLARARRRHGANDKNFVREVLVRVIYHPLASSAAINSSPIRALWHDIDRGLGLAQEWGFENAQKRRTWPSAETGPIRFGTCVWRRRQTPSVDDRGALEAPPRLHAARLPLLLDLIIVRGEFILVEERKREKVEAAASFPFVSKR